MTPEEKLYRIRKIEERIAEEYPKGEMRCPVHLSIGQEACAVAMCESLTKQDLMVSTHRSHAHYLAKGGDLRAMLGELYGKATGCSRGQGGSMHLVDRSVGFYGSTSIVGGTIPIGVGLAWAQKLRGENNITVICIGDAAVEEGVFHESANFAALHKLPVVFLCEDNRFSCFTENVDRNGGKGFSLLADAHGLAYEFSAGVSLQDMINAGSAAVVWARCGRPTLLKINTWRHVEHCGPHNDDNLGYRDQNLNARWREVDNEMVPRGPFPAIDKSIEEAFTAVKVAPYPSHAELGKFLYA